jgi:hypothetical protein
MTSGLPNAVGVSPWANARGETSPLGEASP